MRPCNMMLQLLLGALLLHPSLGLLLWLLPLLLLRLLWELLLLLHPDPLGQGRPWIWSVVRAPWPRWSFFSSRLRTLDRRLTSLWSAVRWLPWAHTRGGLGVSEMSFGSRQEKSKRSCPPRISNTQPHAATHARFCSSMREAAGSRGGVVVVAVADPRQVFVLLLSPRSTPYGGGGCWQAGRLAGWRQTPSSQPFTQEGEWEKRGVELVGAQLRKTSALTGGCSVLKGGCTEGADPHKKNFNTFY